MREENIVENHPKLSEEEKRIWYKSFLDYCAYINDKYSDKIN